MLENIRAERNKFYLKQERENMNNEEKLLTIEDAYDATYDFLEKIYGKTKSEDIFTIFSDMSLLGDGKSADPAILRDWKKAIDKLFTQKPNIRERFEIADKRLGVKDAYEAMINFLDTYNYFNEIVTMLDSMRFVDRKMPNNIEAWTSWVESVNKILSKNPRIRPLFFGINSKVLTIDDAYDTMIDYLNEYYNRIKANDIKKLLERMKRLENGEFVNPTIQRHWSKTVDVILKQNVHNNKDAQIPENGLSATEGYNAVINFLNMYNHEANSNEIITLLDGMKLLNELKSTDREAWHSWLESVNKTLNKYRKF